MTEAERVKAWRDKQRGRPPRIYQKRTPKGLKQFGGPKANRKRAAAIRAAWDDPLRRALMRVRKLKGDAYLAEMRGY